MNVERQIKKRFYFLVDRGYLYTHIHEKRLFHEFQFQKQNYCISISYDLHYEFLNLTIKNNTKILFQASYDCIVVNYLNCGEKDFSCLLKDIYSLPRRSYSLSEEQFIMLIDLYVDCIMTFLDQQV